MKGFRFDVQTLCKIILTGIIITMSGATILLYLISGSKEILFGHCFYNECGIMESPVNYYFPDAPDSVCGKTVQYSGLHDER